MHGTLEHVVRYETASKTTHTTVVLLQVAQDDCSASSCHSGAVLEGTKTEGEMAACVTLLRTLRPVCIMLSKHRCSCSCFYDQT